MLVVALTGGIGSGKSLVAELFSRHGAPVIDTDQIARELVVPGQPAYDEIVALFGQAILGPDQLLDRRRLRERVFADPARRRQLEAILHPRIRQMVQQRIAQLQAPYCIVVIPLLAETAADYAFIDRVLVVDAEPQQQLERSTRRDQQAPDEIRQILAAQADREQRLALADDIIDNRGDPQQLPPQVAALDARYRELA